MLNLPYFKEMVVSTEFGPACLRATLRRINYINIQSENLNSVNADIFTTLSESDIVIAYKVQNI